MNFKNLFFFSFLQVRLMMSLKVLQMVEPGLVKFLVSQTHWSYAQIISQAGFGS